MAACMAIHCYLFGGKNTGEKQMQEKEEGKGGRDDMIEALKKTGGENSGVTEKSREREGKTELKGT